MLGLTNLGAGQNGCAPFFGLWMWWNMMDVFFFKDSSSRISPREVKMAAWWLPPSEPSGRANGFPSAKVKRR